MRRENEWQALLRRTPAPGQRLEWEHIFRIRYRPAYEACSAYLSEAAEAQRARRSESTILGDIEVATTYAPSGAVTEVLVSAEYADTAYGACVAACYREERAPPFDGPPVTVSATRRVWLNAQ